MTAGYGKVVREGTDRMKHVLDMSLVALAAKLKELGEKPFRAKQIFEWIWTKGVYEFHGMTNLSLLLREQLKERLTIFRGRVAEELRATDGVRKLLLEWPDGLQVETVLIPANDRRTACVSTQVGCPLGCAFCASGLDGFKRNLTAGEIIEQVLQLQRAGGGACVERRVYGHRRAAAQLRCDHAGSTHADRSEPVRNFCAEDHRIHRGNPGCDPPPGR